MSPDQRPHQSRSAAASHGAKGLRWAQRLTACMCRCSRFLLTLVVDVLMASYQPTTLRHREKPAGNDVDRVHRDLPTVAKQWPGSPMRYLNRDTGHYDVSLRQHRNTKDPRLARIFPDWTQAEETADAANRALGTFRRGLIWGITLGVTAAVQLCNGGFIVNGQQSSVSIEENAPSMLPHMADIEDSAGQDQSDSDGAE